VDGRLHVAKGMMQHWDQCDLGRSLWLPKVVLGDEILQRQFNSLETDVGFVISIQQYDHPYVERPWTRCYPLRWTLLLVACYTVLPIVKELPLAFAAYNTRRRS
jgi:hypothetical protein